MTDRPKVGDVVRLKSGGPLMTVEFDDFGTLYLGAHEATTGRDRIFVRWATGGEVLHDSFSAAELEIVRT
jgi:hypothetical protein